MNVSMAIFALSSQNGQSAVIFIKRRVLFDAVDASKSLPALCEGLCSGLLGSLSMRSTIGS
jgi:hypothetical protein